MESLQQIMTSTLKQLSRKSSIHSVDFGIRVTPASSRTTDIRLLKLHGSLGWRATWPISRGHDEQGTVWIPPGIRKAHNEYPFSVLWGLAREMLDCDVLRVVGCRLDNDWDVVSLLFTMRHGSFPNQPRVEIIDAPSRAEEIAKAFPYLEVQSILEVEPIGKQFVTELSGLPAMRFAAFNEEDRRHIIDSAVFGRNWFELWLTQKVEHLSSELPDMSTQSGFVEHFLGALE